MTHKKALAIVLIDGFADWEFPFLAASARQWFNADIAYFTPGASPVTSIGGMEFAAGLPLEQLDASHFDALVVVGSDGWLAGDTPDLGTVIKQFNKNDKIIGGICAGTLALARSGLLDTHKHTSNEKNWLAQNAQTYKGHDHYQEVKSAVRDGNIITAAGSAPATFALALLEALYPAQTQQISQMRKMFAAEHSEVS